MRLIAGLGRRKPPLAGCSSLSAPRLLARLAARGVSTATEGVQLPQPLPFEPALHSADALESLLTSLRPLGSSVPKSLHAIKTHFNPFLDSQRTPELQVHEATENPTTETANLTLTDNLGVTNASTLSPTLDLFNELGSVEKDEMCELLDSAWKEDPLATLKIIWSARSIPRGKGEKEAWTRRVASLAEEHPQILLRNLENDVLPLDLIPKKSKAADQEQESNADLCEVEEEAAELTPASARSQGYLKDLLNLLYLSPLASTATPPPLLPSRSSRSPGAETQPRDGDQGRETGSTQR
ncbi:hypothetical protein BCR35DRAFT_354041 [Leucosporidium creatinivorum]|uniref:DUF2828 domain-containing protein n=1 Tax=Leucosporidium creatinivorum TaxID=106004 RepID=A0A1Y2EQ03_9BASI|nr:hypothetical protein BCR35DRAFT_354041 [Leucosporidium creatinivorum]